MKTRILYVPGLGDGYDGFRRFTLNAWRFWGATTELVPMTWYDGKNIAQKLERIDAALLRAEKRGEKCVLVGESAGASVALVAASAHPEIKKVITICGVTQASTPIARHLRAKAPALDEAVKKLSNIPFSSSRTIESIRSIHDPVVGRKYSTASGARSHVVYVPGHLFTIIVCLTVLSYYMVRLSRVQQ